jgi:hypothetical protein
MFLLGSGSIEAIYSQDSHTIIFVSLGEDRNMAINWESYGL